MIEAKEKKKKYHLPFDKIEAFGCRQYKYFLAYSPLNKKKMESLNPKIITRVIPNGVSEEMFDVITHEGDYGAFIGRIDITQKGLDLLIEACSVLKAKGINPKIKLAGNGPQEDESRLKKMIIDNGLSEYGDESFDYVILNQSIQQVKKPDIVLREALRVGKKVVVGFPNFAHYSSRFQIFFSGRTPLTPSLPYQWYETPNLHFLSISDFRDYCQKQDIRIKKSAFIGNNAFYGLFPNLFAQTGLFLISKYEQE